MPAELNIVVMPRPASLEDENELVLAAIEGAHAGIVFGPDAQVLQLGVDGLRRVQQFPDMPPVHAQVMERPVAAIMDEERADTSQEVGKRPLIHLARCHREVAMMDAAETAR